jgi:DNA-binding response OmpR family regulator
MKVLIVEHLQSSIKSFEHNFKEAGYVCEFLNGYKAATEKLALYEYDCVLLNYVENNTDIFDFLLQQEQNNHIGGLIVLSANTAVENKVKLLNMGADDFITAPFHFLELIARTTAVIRRKKFQTNHKIYFANLVIEFHLRKVFVWNNTVDLTKKEYEILLYLIGNKDKVVSRLSLAEYLWGDDTGNMDSFNILTAHIKNIRRKMKDAKAEIEIKNSYGVGYQIVEL